MVRDFGGKGPHKPLLATCLRLVITVFSVIGEIVGVMVSGLLLLFETRLKRRQIFARKTVTRFRFHVGPAPVERLVDSDEPFEIRSVFTVNVMISAIDRLSRS